MLHLAGKVRSPIKNEFIDCPVLHQPLVHAMAKLLKRLAVKHTMEDGTPFTAERGFRTNIAVPTGRLRRLAGNHTSEARERYQRRYSRRYF